MKTVYILLILLYSSEVLSAEADLKTDIQSVNERVSELKVGLKNISIEQLTVLTELNRVARDDNSNEKLT